MVPQSGFDFEILMADRSLAERSNVDRALEVAFV